MKCLKRRPSSTSSLRTMQRRGGLSSLSHCDQQTWFPSSALNLRTPSPPFGSAPRSFLQRTIRRRRGMTSTRSGCHAHARPSGDRHVKTATRRALRSATHCRPTPYRLSPRRSPNRVFFEPECLTQSAGPSHSHCPVTETSIAFSPSSLVLAVSDGDRDACGNPL